MADQQAQILWVRDPATFEQAKRYVQGREIGGFSAKGSDNDGRPMIRCWNSSNQRVATILFLSHGVRMCFARFLTEHLGISDVQLGVAKAALVSQHSFRRRQEA